MATKTNIEAQPKILFIHGRPKPHPIHEAYALSIGSKLQLVDPVLRWHDTGGSKFKRYLSWVVCGILISFQREYRYIITEGLHFPPSVARWLLLLNRKCKLIGLMDDEGLYFIESGYYTGKSKLFNLKLLKSYDYLICIGDFQASLAQKLVVEEGGRIYKGFNGVSEHRIHDLLKTSPNLSGQNLLYIANGPGNWRGWYKGIDILLSSFEEAKKHLPDLKLTIVGQWEQSYIDSCMKSLPDSVQSAINWAGLNKNITPFFNESSLYIHTGRGEAWGISVNEAMFAGIPVIVSNLTGSSECLKSQPQLIFDLERDVVVNKILWYFRLPLEEKQHLSEQMRNLAKPYTQQNAIEKFKELFNEIRTDNLDI